jgi:hypothetical protein
MAALDLSRVMAKIDAIGEGFANQEAKVGFFADQAYPDGGPPVGYVAAIQEFGSPENGIPPRPFMRPTVEDKKGEWAADITNGMRAVIKGRMTAYDVLDHVGRAAAGDIVKTIVGGDFKQLSPITLMLRKMRDEHQGNATAFRITGATVGEAARRVASGEQGSTRTAPLDDTGYLAASVQHQVGDAS